MEKRGFKDKYMGFYVSCAQENYLRSGTILFSEAKQHRDQTSLGFESSIEPPSARPVRGRTK
jgi:hypothetical protein